MTWLDYLTSYNLQFRFLHQQQKRHWTLCSDIINILQLLSGGETTNLGEYSRHMTRIQSAYNTGAICEGRGTKKRSNWRKHLLMCWSRFTNWNHIDWKTFTKNLDYVFEGKISASNRLNIVCMHSFLSVFFSEIYLHTANTSFLSIFSFAYRPGWWDRDKNLAEILSLVRISFSVSRGGGSAFCSSTFCAGELVPRLSK